MIAKSFLVLLSLLCLMSTLYSQQIFPFPPNKPGDIFNAYVGCYGDGDLRSMSTNFGLVSSVKDCFNIASFNHYSFYGIQYGGECWVSNEFTSATKYGLCGDCVQNGCGNPNCDCTAVKCASGEDCGDRFGNRLFAIAYSPTKTPTFTPTAFLPTQAPLSNQRKEGLYDWNTFGGNNYRSSMYPYETKISSSTATTLTRKWKTKLAGGVVGQPVVALDYAMTNGKVMSVAFFGDYAGGFYAMNIKTGNIEWTRNFPVYTGYCGDLPKWGITGAATFNRTSDAVYVVGGDTFYSLSMMTGETHWSIPNMYDFSALQNYGALLVQGDLVYVTLGSRCDIGLFYGGVISVSIIQQKVINKFYPTGYPNNPSIYGGGVWGIAGVTIGEPMLFSNGEISTPLYIATGNCFSVNENDELCEQILKLDLSMTAVDSIFIPPFNPIAGDNDFGVTVLYFNAYSEGQSSGCKTPLLAATRKDGKVFILNAVTLDVIQSIQIAPPEFAQYHSQSAWDYDSNILVIPTFKGYTPFNLPDGGLIAYKLDATCQLTHIWNTNIFLQSSLTIAGPIGRKVIFSGGGFRYNVVDLLTGQIIATPGIEEFVVATLTVIDGIVIVPGFDSNIYGFGTFGTDFPSILPTEAPTAKPTKSTTQPTYGINSPTPGPTFQSTPQPSSQPMIVPTRLPTFSPTTMPTTQPVPRPSSTPVYKPSTEPTSNPTSIPSLTPSFVSTSYPLIFGVSYKLIGCYGDGGNRALTQNMGVVYSIADCIDLAYLNHYKYASLQYGGECWVSNDFKSATKYGFCGDCEKNKCENPTCNCAAVKCSSGEDCGDALGNLLFRVNFNSTHSPSHVPTLKPSTRTPTSQPSSKPTSLQWHREHTPHPTQNPIVTFISATSSTLSADSVGMISGLTIGIILGCLICVVLIFFTMCHKSSSDKIQIKPVHIISDNAAMDSYWITEWQNVISGKNKDKASSSHSSDDLSANPINGYEVANGRNSKHRLQKEHDCLDISIADGMSNSDDTSNFGEQHCHNTTNNFPSNDDIESDVEPKIYFYK